MNPNIVALGRVFLVFVVITALVAGVHFLGGFLGINPMYLFAGIFVAYLGWIMFDLEKRRVIRERTAQEK